MSSPFSRTDYLQLLNTEIEKTDRSLLDFKSRHYNRVREYAVIYCMERASDIAKGLSASISEGHIHAESILVRGLLEVLIQEYWLIQSSENTAKFTQAFSTNMLRFIRLTLEKKHGTITDETTGVNKTQEFLESELMKQIPSNLGMEKMTKEANIELLYTLFYRPLSFYAHGFTFEMPDQKTEITSDPKFAAIAAPFLSGINQIATRWIKFRKVLGVEDLYNGIGI